MHKSILVIIFLFLFSFTAYAQSISKLKEANYLEVRFFKGKQPSIYKTQRDIDLRYLKALIAKAQNKNDLNCDTTGEILYLKDNQLIFKVYFSTHATGSKFRSGAITYTINNHPTTSLFTYNAGMMIDELFYELKTAN